MVDDFYSVQLSATDVLLLARRLRHSRDARDGFGPSEHALLNKLEAVLPSGLRRHDAEVDAVDIEGQFFFDV